MNKRTCPKCSEYHAEEQCPDCGWKAKELWLWPKYSGVGWDTKPEVKRLEPRRLYASCYTVRAAFVFNLHCENPWTAGAALDALTAFCRRLRMTRGGHVLCWECEHVQGHGPSCSRYHAGPCHTLGCEFDALPEEAYCSEHIEHGGPGPKNQPADTPTCTKCGEVRDSKECLENHRPGGWYKIWRGTFGRQNPHGIPSPEQYVHYRSQFIEKQGHTPTSAEHRVATELTWLHKLCGLVDLVWGKIEKGERHPRQVFGITKGDIKGKRRKRIPKIDWKKING